MDFAIAGLEILKYVIPSLVVFGVTYMILQKFLEDNYSRKLLDIRTKNSELITPVRLQAYERLILLLERISPNNLVLRLNHPGITAGQFKGELISSIHEEFNHNLSQQIYVSPQAWALIKAVKEQVINLINTSYVSLADDAKSIDLSKAIFERMIQLEDVPTQKALDFIRKEVQLVFFQN